MILEIFSGSFEYAFKNKNAFKSVIKVGILSILSFLILPIFILFGFSYRTILIGLTGSISFTKDPMPKFNNLGNLFIEGAETLFVSIIYYLPTIIITAILFMNELTSIDFVNLSDFSINISFNINFLIVIILCFISFMFLSTAIPHMVNNNSLLHAFKIKDLINLIKYTSVSNYLMFFIISIILFVVFTFVDFILSQILVAIINNIHIAFYSVDLTVTILGYLNVIMFLLFFLFSMGLYLIIESRAISFMYNVDGLENNLD